MQGLINEEEYNEFSQMVLDENDEKIFDLMDECICKNTNAYVMPSDVKLNLYDRIWEQIRKENIRVRLRKISSLAASILLPLFIFSTVYFYFQVDEYKHRPNVIVAENGQKAEFTLPDGSKVHLNGGSKLSYNAAYNGRLREVSLEGEAFFDVKQDKEKPFIVKTSVFDVEVLGTSFNVSAYDEDPTVQAALIEGSLRFESAQGCETMKPDDLVTYDCTTCSMHREQVDAGQFCSWIDGNIRYDAITLPALLKKLARKHAVVIELRTADFDTKTFRISLTQAQDIESILNGLCDILPITVKRDENGYYVYSRP